MKAATEWFALFKHLSPHLALVLEWMLKTGLLFGIAWLVVALLRNRSARARCWIWRLLFVSFAVLPVVEWSPWLMGHVRPRVEIAVEAQTRQSFRESAEKFQMTRSQEELQELLNRRKAEHEEIDPRGRAPWEREIADYLVPTVADFRSDGFHRLETVVPWVWGVVSLLVLLWLGLGSLVGLRRLRQTSVAADEAVLKAAREVCHRLCVRRTPEVRLFPGLSTPLLSGFFRPIVYLPASAVEWGHAKLLDVFFHELSHWKRRDFLWLQAGRIMVALFWWNPCFRHALRRMNETAEEAADDMVLLSRQPADAYARTLVEIAAGMVPSRNASGLPMIGYRSLEKRIARLMSENRWRGKLGKLAATAMLGTLVIGSLIASVQIGLPVPTPTKASPAHALTPRQKEVAERIIASTKARLEAFRRTHVTLEMKLVEEDGPKRVVSPMPTRMEAWWDLWTNCYRAQFRPRVLRWINGATDFSISDQTTVSDGKWSYDWSEGEVVRGRQRSYGESVNLYPDYLSIDDSQHLIRVLSGILRDSSLQQGPAEYAIIETEWQGREAVSVVETFHRQNKVHQQKTIVVATTEDDLICFSETLFPQEPDGNFRRKTVHRIGRIADGERYASDYTTVSFREKVITTTHHRLTSFELLAELPDGILDLPKAETVEAVSETPPVQPEEMAIQCIEPESGTPVSGVKLLAVVNKKKSTLLTDEEGRATLPLPREEVTFLTLRTRKPGHAPRLLRWNKEGDPLRIPATCSIRLPKGEPIFGKVVNEAGEGIAGASVRFHLDGTPGVWGAFVDGFDLTDRLVVTKTDSEGRWRLPDFPASLNQLLFRISAPGYQATTDLGLGDFRSSTGLPYTALRDGTAVVTLQSGHELRGRITDRKGAPVAKCRVVVGRDRHGSNLPTTHTDADGGYHLKGLRSGATWITVESPLHQPVAREIALPVEGALDFVLEPGRVIRGRVTLPDGTLSAGLNVDVDQWNGLRTLAFSTQTDAQGRFVWHGAPEEPVEFVFGACQNREFLTDLPLSASGQVHEIVMKPALRFSGRVVDEATGKPVEIFTLTPGETWESGLVAWDGERRRTFRGGAFDWSGSRWGCRHRFRFEAPGYQPLVTAVMEARQQSETATVRLKVGDLDREIP